MPVRTTSEEVKEVIATSLADAVVLSNFIATANVYVDAHLSAAGLSEAILTKIEMYLAAHLIAFGPEELGGLISDKAGDATSKFANVYSAGLGSTRYGQTAMMLDTSGTLQRLSSTKPRAELTLVQTIEELNN